jgi:hypothetical protein
MACLPLQLQSEKDGNNYEFIPWDHVQNGGKEEYPELTIFLKETCSCSCQASCYCKWQPKQSTLLFVSHKMEEHKLLYPESYARIIDSIELHYRQKCTLSMYFEWMIYRENKHDFSIKNAKTIREQREKRILNYLNKSHVPKKMRHMFFSGFNWKLLKQEYNDYLQEEKKVHKKVHCKNNYFSVLADIEEDTLSEASTVSQQEEIESQEESEPDETDFFEQALIKDGLLFDY